MSYYPNGNDPLGPSKGVIWAMLIVCSFYLFVWLFYWSVR